MNNNRSQYERFFNEFMEVEKPGRYSGGEYGSIPADVSAPLRVALCFPDLYEIGMSNNAIRIMYQLFNSIRGVSCERVFSPAPDFEELLRARSIKLFSLESGTPLCDFDIVAFSIGYELAATNVLAVLDTGGIALRRTDRGEQAPLVIAGGPAITNPEPFGDFFDAIFVGEAEGVMGSALEDLVTLKRRDSRREDLLQSLLDTGYFWNADGGRSARRAVWMDFGLDSVDPRFPIPGIKTVQDHGVVEIMRGCPNGCRFCHAGIFYRPYREKSFSVIDKEVEALITRCGYREMTITSLSTGDYSGVVPVVKALHAKYGHSGVSFSLPSLRVNSFTLPLLSSVSAVRKSGLTFAVETPVAGWQKGLNKMVELEKTVEIMLEAKKLGWRIAKFYFMIGLPVSEGKDETSSIVEFLAEIKRRSGMNINVNVGTFVPKPHTPYQWAPQLDEMSALDRIHTLKNELRNLKIQLRYHSPFASQIEGVITRGDRRVGALIEEAYRRGARLDAWEDHLDRGLWKNVIAEAGWDVVADTCGAREVDDSLPWDGVRLGISKTFLKSELKKSLESELTERCAGSCDLNCGVCGTKHAVRNRSDQVPEALPEPVPSVTSGIGYAGFVVFSFRKTGRAVFLSHLNVMTAFERGLLRAGIDVRYTEGFNPKPKLEFASPLSLGYQSRDEIARVEVTERLSADEFCGRLNTVLHEGLSINFAATGERIENRRLKGIMSSYWGADYSLSSTMDEGHPSIRKTHELFLAYISENALEKEIRVADRGRRILIRIKQAGKKTSLRSILEKIVPDESWWAYWRVKKLKSYSTSEAEGPCSFF